MNHISDFQKLTNLLLDNSFTFKVIRHDCFYEVRFSNKAVSFRFDGSLIEINK
jgi:hypothetical protein